jgi:hypothetical protein
MLKPQYKHKYETLKDQLKAKKAFADFHSRLVTSKVKQENPVMLAAGNSYNMYNSLSSRYPQENPNFNHLNTVGSSGSGELEYLPQVNE